MWYYQKHFHWHSLILLEIFFIEIPVGVTVNKYSPKKELPDYFFTSEKALPQYLLSKETVLPLGKKCSPILRFWLHVSRNLYWE